jgi:hypothetical protein
MAGQPRKRAVIEAFRELIGEGTLPTNKQIAERAGVAEDTVRRYLRQVSERSPSRLPKPPRQPHLVSADGVPEGGIVSFRRLDGTTGSYRVRRSDGQPGSLVFDLREPLDPATLRTRPPVAD